MINKLKQRMRKSLNSTKGFTLVELIVVTVIILILATMAVNAYLSFVEDAAIAKDVAYLKSVVTELEILCAKREIVLPSNLSATPTTTSSVNYTGAVVMTKSTGWGWSGYYYNVSSSSSTTATANLDKLKAVCNHQSFESNTVNSLSEVVIKYQQVNFVAKVYVYSPSPATYWYPYAQTWGGADSF